MAHPFYDAISYPWDREDARNLHHALGQGVPDSDWIRLYYQQAKATLPGLASGAPQTMWKHALDNLVTAKALQQFCELLLDDDNLATIHPAIQAVVESSEATSTSEEPNPTIAIEALSPQPGRTDFKYDISFSFAGDNKRDKVRRIAELLQPHFEDDRVFFDEWFEALLAGNDADIVLQNIYTKQTWLVVICLCDRYDGKPWTQEEWRAIRAWERDLRDADAENLKRLRLLPLMFGDGDISGIPANAIVPRVGDRSEEDITALILDRYRRSLGE